MESLFKRKIVAGGFGLAMLVLSTVSVISYRNTTELFERQKQVEQTYQVLQQIGDVMATLRDAERARRGYIITGKEFYLGTYNIAVKQINAQFNAVRLATGENPEHQHRLNIIEPIISQRLALIEKSINLYKQNQSDRKSQIHLTDKGLLLHDEISKIMSKIEEDEKLLLQRQAADSEASFRNTVLMEIAGFGFSFSLFFAVYWILNKQIQKRQRTEEILRESEQRYRKLFESHPYPLWVYDLENLAFLAVNETAVNHYGYSQEEFLSMTIKDIYPLEDVPRILQKISKLLPGVKRVGIERHQKRDETIIDVEITSYEVLFAGRRARLLLALDITEEKQAQEALKASEEKFRQIAENSSEVFWMSDVKLNHLLYINSAYEQIWGRTCESLYANPLSFLDAVHSEDRERAIANLKNNPTTEFQIEYRIVQPDGSIRWIFERGFPIKNAAGEIYRRVGIAQDITERKRVEEVRHTLEKEKELSELKLRFFSMASHEFRTPLSTILISVQLLENFSQEWPSEKKHKNLHRIKSAAKTMTQLLTDILTLTRAEAGKLEFKPEWLDLEKLCDNLVEEMELIYRAENRILLISNSPVKNVFLDEKILRSILSNLLSNAVKYSPEDRQIYFTFNCESDAAIFQIQDQGIGISPEDQKNLFESFYRGKNVGDVPGTGLGLPVVKKCVDLHGGSISVESQVGVGTTFTVRLPLTSQSIADCRLQIADFPDV